MLKYFITFITNRGGKEKNIQPHQFPVHADAYWGTGLDVNATLHTDPSKWPGKNELGKIVKKVAGGYTRRVRSASVPRRNTKLDDSQQCMDKFIRDLKRGRSKRPKTSESGESDLSSYE